MQDVKESRLGEAITSLGLEDRFLSDGELKKFPLAQRGRITNGIISEKLRQGRWQGVIKMIFGGFGKADALYEGDRDKLKQEIIESAKIHPGDSLFSASEVLGILAKNGEHDLIFNLLTANPPQRYKDFINVAKNIPEDYFQDKQHGLERRKVYNTMAAERALNERDLYAALHHFKEVGNHDGISKVFEAFLAGEGDISYSKEIAEQLALFDPSQKKERLRRVVLSCTSGKGLEAVACYKLLKKHQVQLTEQEQEALYGKVAEKADYYDLELKLSGAESSLFLLWAKKHAKSDPRTAYDIFKKQDYHGEEAVIAVQTGLALEHYKNETRAVDITQVKEEDLKAAYLTAPFKVRVQIAQYFRQGKQLRALSKEADKKKDRYHAYQLWVEGNGDLTCKYITRIRRQEIQDSIKRQSRIIHIYQFDNPGRIQAYDALMEAAETNPENQKTYISDAYEMAIGISGDASRLQRAREKMVAIDPKWALWQFSRESIQDKVGINYLLGIVAQNTGSDIEALRGLVEKYSSK